MIRCKHKENEPNMIVITFLTLFALYSVDCSYSQFSQGHVKCCFSFSNVRFLSWQIVSYQTTHLQCQREGLIFITVAQREICADPNNRLVQRLKNLVDKRIQRGAIGRCGRKICLLKSKQRSTPESNPKPKMAPVPEHEPKPTTVSEREPESEQEQKPAAVSELKPESEPEPEPESIGTERTTYQRSTQFCMRHENN